MIAFLLYIYICHNLSFLEIYLEISYNVQLHKNNRNHSIFKQLGIKPPFLLGSSHAAAALPRRRSAERSRWRGSGGWRSQPAGCRQLGGLKQGCPNDPLENQMMKPNSESHKQNQTNKWWQSAGFLFRTQIGLPLLTIEFLLVRSPKGALQRWRLGWSDKLTGFPRDETLFAVVFLLSE